MVYSTKELYELGENDYSIKNRLKDESLFLVERGFYSTSYNTFLYEQLLTKKYPRAILTGISAFALYDLTDSIPKYLYLATLQHSFPIRRKDVKQSYQEKKYFEIGVVEKDVFDMKVRTYDLERLLIELVRLKEKYPRELYYEVLQSFRDKKHEIDFYKLNKYAKSFKNGSNLLFKIKEII